MAQIDCGTESVLIVTNKGGSSGYFVYNGQTIYLVGQSTMQLACTGLNDIVPGGGAGVVTYTVDNAPVESITWAEPMGFLSGALVAVCFVQASLRRWF